MSAPSTSTTDPTHVTLLLTDIDELEQKLKLVSAERDDLAAHLATAERSIIDVRAGYQHKLDNLRGRIIGTLTGRMERLLSTALEAARAETPRVAVIIERVEIVTEMLATFVQQERNPNERSQETPMSTTPPAAVDGFPTDPPSEALIAELTDAQVESVLRQMCAAWTPEEDPDFLIGTPQSNRNLVISTIAANLAVSASPTSGSSPEAERAELERFIAVAKAAA
jgi:hypothetical protein